MKKEWPIPGSAKQNGKNMQKKAKQVLLVWVFQNEYLSHLDKGS